MKTFTANKLASLPPAKWQAQAERIHPQDISNYDLAIFARAAAMHFTRMAVYFDQRHLGQSHREAVKESARVVTTLRRALKYSYPKDTLTF